MKGKSVVVMVQWGEGGDKGKEGFAIRCCGHLSTRVWPATRELGTHARTRARAHNTSSLWSVMLLAMELVFCTVESMWTSNRAID